MIRLGYDQSSIHRIRVKTTHLKGSQIARTQNPIADLWVEGLVNLKMRCDRDTQHSTA